MASKRAASPVSPPPLKRKIESSVTNTTVASFFKPASQKEPERLTWRIVNKSLLIGQYSARKNGSSPVVNTTLALQKFAIFDLDDTLITSNTGNKWSRSGSSWKWCHQAVSTKLRELWASGFRIVIFSNQSTVSLKDNPKVLREDSASLVNFKSQLTAVLGKLDLPISVYAATGDDIYRKPRIGMWKEMLEDHGLDAPGIVDIASSFYVGDAAGREKTATRPKDHACSDRDLAANIGIKFYTPQEYFDGAKPEPFSRAFEPPIYINEPQNVEENEGNNVYQKANALDIVMFCGSPGAGKSTFFWRKLEPLGYERVNQDTLKTRERCLKVAREYLGTGRSVAVDNTNANTDTRSHWVELARSHSIPIRCVNFTASTRLCEHNDTVRAMNPTSMNPENRSKLPPVAFRSFASRYTIPTVSEGFQDVTNVDFKFDGTAEQRDLWAQYWISKFST